MLSYNRSAVAGDVAWAGDHPQPAEAQGPPPTRRNPPTANLWFSYRSADPRRTRAWRRRSAGCSACDTQLDTRFRRPGCTVSSEGVRNRRPRSAAGQQLLCTSCRSSSQLLGLAAAGNASRSQRQVQTDGMRCSRAPRTEKLGQTKYISDIISDKLVNLLLLELGHNEHPSPHPTTKLDHFFHSKVTYQGLRKVCND